MRLSLCLLQMLVSKIVIPLFIFMALETLSTCWTDIKTDYTGRKAFTTPTTTLTPMACKTSLSDDSTRVPAVIMSVVRRLAEVKNRKIYAKSRISTGPKIYAKSRIQMACNFCTCTCTDRIRIFLHLPATRAGWPDALLETVLCQPCVEIYLNIIWTFWNK